jgi:hypothetical protein
MRADLAGIASTTRAVRTQRSGGDPIRLEPPTEPPVLNPLAAKALLTLLVNAHNRAPVTTDAVLPWDKAG